MNRKEEEAKRFTTEFAESVEKEFGAEFAGGEVDSRKLKVEREKDNAEAQRSPRFAEKL